MHYSTKEVVVSNIAKKSINRVWVSLGVTVISVGVALIAIFILANWAEISPVHHAVQHVLIFLAGMGFGGSSLYLSKKGLNHEG